MKCSVRKIAVLTPRYGLIGGFERFAQELTERIALNPSYEIHVFANKWRTGSGLVTFHKVPVIAFPRFLKPLSFAWFAHRKLRAMDFELIHSHERVFYADVFSMHGIPHPIWVTEVRKKKMSLFDRATSWIEKRMIEHGKCRSFLPVSTLTQENYARGFSIDPSKVRVIHPGVDVARFDRTKRESRQRIRRRFNIDECDVVILFVGMNFEIKGLDRLISSIAEVKRKYPAGRIKLLVVGKGDHDKYRKLSRCAGVGEAVIFAGVWKDRIEEAYLAADMFSQLSEFDTFGLTVLEAMASSLPVIISDRVGAKDLVRNGINGFIVKREDISGIASGIIFLMDEENREKFSKEARRTAIQHSWESVSEKVAAVYEELLTDRTGRKSHRHDGVAEMKN